MKRPIGRLCSMIAVVLLVTMAVVMVSLSLQDSATVDETTYLGAGWTFWQGYRYYLVADHPPVDQMLASLPLLAMDVRLSDNAKALLSKQVGYPWTLTWDCQIQPVKPLFPQGRDNWYFWAMPEGQLFGQILVYDGANNAEAMMLSGRLTQVALTLLAGVFIFWWARRLAGPVAAVLALVAWVANPLILAYGHLIITDVGAMVTIPVAVFALGRFVESPNRTTAIWAGATLAAALAFKYTSLTLGPILLALAALYQVKRRPSLNHWKTVLRNCGWAVLAGWLVLLVAYLPEWKVPPPITAEQADQLGIPGWFQSLRLVLLPRDFFKGLAIGLAQAHHPRDSYLDGQWRTVGCWYYFPVALFLKTPISLLALAAIALGFLCKRIRQLDFAMLVPWLAAGVYLLMAMTSKVNIGVRHTLPIFPLLCVCIASQWTVLSQRWRLLVWLLVGWLVLETAFSYPLYIQYFNEFAGGATDGYKHLIDSNYDWGQDAKRLKQYLDDHNIDHIYIDYFGTQENLNSVLRDHEPVVTNTPESQQHPELVRYHPVALERVDANTARQITNGWLVVSVSELMRPEWAWLRESREPTARVADTLFLYNSDDKNYRHVLPGLP